MLPHAEVLAAAFAGEAVQPLHAPLITKLGSGVLRLHTGDGVKRMAVRGGFLEVKDDDVTMLVTKAVVPEDVDPTTVERDLSETIEALQHPESQERFDELLAQRAWLEVCLRMHA